MYANSSRLLWVAFALTLCVSSWGEDWVTRFNGLGNGVDKAHAIARNSLGYVYVVGEAYYNPTRGTDYCIVKYDRLGRLVWDTGLDNGAVYYDGPAHPSRPIHQRYRLGGPHIRH
jgi:hypothetical protein